MDAKQQAQWYRELMGDAAYLRQAVEADSRYPCCASLKIEGHNPLCKHHPKLKAERLYREHFGNGVT